MRLRTDRRRIDVRRASTSLLVLAALVAGACSGSGESQHPRTSATIASPALEPTTDPSTRSSTVGIEASVILPPAPSHLDAAPDAAEFAAALSSAHGSIIDPASPPDTAARYGEQLQLLLRALADQPALDEAVLAALDPEARPTIERVIRARQFLQARSAADTTPSEPATQLPAWTIVEPEPSDTLLAHYAEAEAITGIPWYWLAAIHLQETRMGRIQGVSSAGAVGPMQFLPSTWAECCTGDPLGTRDAIIGAATYLAQSGGPVDMSAAVRQYNPNDGYVAVVTAYAENLRDLPELYRGYHAFQVFFASAAGVVRLPIGYSQPAPIDAAAYLAANPADAA